MGKATPGKVQPQSRKRVTGAGKKPRVFTGWKVCKNLLRKSMKEIRKGSFQLIHVLTCSELLHGVEAEVNWYIGGNSYVALPTAVAAKRPGVYLAKAKFIRFKDFPEEPEDEQGPERAVASISHLRWLGARKEFMKIAKSPNSIKHIRKNQHQRLMEMLNFNCDSSDVETVGGNPQSRALS